MSHPPLPSDRPLEGLGRALEALRKQRGWSRAKLARAAGVAPETVARCEKESSHPSARVLEALLAALGAHLGDLFAAQVAAWLEPLRGWPADPGSAGEPAPSRISWLEMRARVGRLHQQLERLKAAVYGESVSQTRGLVQSLSAGNLSASSLPPELRGELDRELAAAADRLRELHNVLQVEPAAALDLQAQYAGGQGAPGERAAGPGSESAGGEKRAGRPAKR